MPQKNLRLLGDRPLIAYTAEAILASGVADRMVVSSDSDEVLRWAELHGYEARRRPAELSGDDTTLSDVAAHVADELEWEGDVGVFQPTSPFRTSESIVEAAERFRAAEVDSLASAARVYDGLWLYENGDSSFALPLFKERALHRTESRQPVLRETGSIQLVRAETLRERRQLVTDSHLLFETSDEEAFRIDTNDDLVIARRRLDQGTVVFRLRANKTVGSGHLYHCLQLADELADQRLMFLLRDCDEFVEHLLEEHSYDYRVETDLGEDLRAIADSGRRLLVNDVLDTSQEDVLVEKTAGYLVVNIEDLGPGAKLADWVVNALYPVQNGAAGHVSTGSEWATLRSEFFHLPDKEIRERAERILITFGGTDPGRLAARCAGILHDRIDAEIRVIVGAGGSDDGFPEGVTVKHHVRSMAAEMLEADLVLTAAGRTVYEAAAVGTPVAVMAQGAREATHAHLSYMSGVVFLGIGPIVDDEHVVGVVKRLLDDHALRGELSTRLRGSVDPWGAARIGQRIRGMLKGL